jgi:hypothetical protein
MLRFWRVIAGIAAAVLVLLGIASPVEGSRFAGSGPTVSTMSRRWASTSPFNRPLPLNLPVVPQSAAWVAALAAQAYAGLYVNSQYWSTPVYHANGSTPRSSFYIGNRRRSLVLPFNPAWKPDQTSDASIAIVDDRTGCLYEMSLVNASAHTANAEATFDVVKGSGVHVPLGVSGGGFAFTAGQIRPEDVASGVIRHALRLATPMNSSQHVFPATSSDGGHPGGIPEGALVRLDPRLDLSQYGLDPFQRMVARALKTYGAYNADNSGSLTLAAQNPLDGSSYPYSLSALPRELVPYLQFVRPPATPVQLERSGGVACRVQPAAPHRKAPPKSRPK